MTGFWTVAGIADLIPGEGRGPERNNATLGFLPLWTPAFAGERGKAETGQSGETAL